MGDEAGEYEEKIRQTVEVADQDFGGVFKLGQANYPAFGAAAYRASQVPERDSRAATRQYEVAQRGQLRIHQIHRLFEQVDVVIAEVRCRAVFAWGGGQVGSQGKQAILDDEQQAPGLFGAGVIAQEAEAGVELIYRAVSLNAEVVFGQPLSAKKAGLAGIAGFGIYLHVRYIGLGAQTVGIAQGLFGSL